MFPLIIPRQSIIPLAMKDRQRFMAWRASSLAVIPSASCSGSSIHITQACLSLRQRHARIAHANYPQTVRRRVEGQCNCLRFSALASSSILVEGAMALPVTHGGGVPFAS